MQQGQIQAQTQEQQQGKPQKPKRKRLPRKHSIILICLFAVVVAAIWIASSIGLIPTFLGINSSGWASIITVVVTIVLGIFTIVPTLPDDTKGAQEVQHAPDAPNPTPAMPILPPINIHIPSSILVSAPAQPDTQQPVLPPTPTPDTSHFSGIRSLPPPTNTSSIQQREIVVKEVYAELTAPDRSSVVLQGMGGIGKSILAALVFNYAEQLRRTGKDAFVAEAIWLSVRLNTTLLDLASSIFEALGTSVPDFPKLQPQQQAYALFNTLNTTDKPRLIVLDQFENFLDWNTGHALPENFGIGEFIDALNSQPCTCRVLLTSRPKPIGTREDLAASMHIYPVGGLSTGEGVALLRSQHVQGSDAELQQAVERCQGHGLSLKLLITLLNDYGVSLSTFLNDPSYIRDWEKDIATRLLDKIYTEHLNPLAQQLLQAFSVYREAVPVEAIHAILDTTSLDEIRATLRELLRQNLFHIIIDGRYELHPIVANHATKHFIENDQVANEKALQAAHAKAAQYYVQVAEKQCPERSKRRSVKDIQPLIEAVWQYCQADQWQKAYYIMNEEGFFDYLLIWSANALLLELCQLLLSAQQYYEPKQLARIQDRFATAQDNLGQKQIALKHFEIALQIRQDVGDRTGEGATLNNLGQVYDTLGELEKALDYYKQALSIVQQGGHRVGEGRTLMNLGWVYNRLGEQQKALDYYEQALSVLRKSDDRRGEGWTLKDIGEVHDALGEKRKALDYYEQALSVLREASDRRGEGRTLHNIGMIYDAQSRYDVALSCVLLAKELFEYVESPSDIDDEVQWIANIRKRIGEKRFTQLLSQVEPRAAEIVEEAMREVRDNMIH